MLYVSQADNVLESEECATYPEAGCNSDGRLWRTSEPQQGHCKAEHSCPEREKQIKQFGSYPVQRSSRRSRKEALEAWARCSLACGGMSLSMRCAVKHLSLR